MDELHDLFASIENTGALKGVILSGSGDRAFVAGADINDFLSLDGDNMEAFVRRGHKTFNSIERFSKPVIAAVNGFALGGGCELAMACHLRIASTTSKFGQPEVNLGIIPGYGGTQRLVQLIGKGKAMELMMTTDMIGSEEALQLGLVNHVVEPGEEIDKAREIIEKIARKAPLAIAHVIDAVNALFSEDREGFEVEIRAFSELAGSADFREGASAFLEKRKPVFQSK
ncbi:UNVERIFIED_CONTAM: hypothetical protein GTU68_035266 [Idotea baltica]|nr:hypothetical protein [Idotea baltica]